ncbi:efflux RND transporter permease subunit [Paenibacillus mucilaginosus]|uniref:Putative efflux system n=1 Tax=Paenibacillus mucilaginosus (strain KNP414) TaxID=1036673 RepID=F8FK66_PAEMK|nr:efflux RND transporter permease subunit [Paenibacillus mucilaginosus]AEI44747.1 putative efflux system [Paenibacillus mucilaginosus KNP414]MCG7214803.1 efflux RND transporter permease subunit [Paenibacillus mucilaginosus]WDM26289.1 efflux RND transporter permease subunit [Paenibacillus mucilaginosus]
MNFLTHFSMKNVAAVLIIIVLLFGGGTYAATMLKAELYPEVSIPYVVVTTQYNAPPKDILDSITKPLEKAVAGLEKIKSLKSVSADGYSSLEIELEHGSNTDDAKRDVEGLIANVKLPKGVEKPKVSTFGMSAIPEYTLAVYGENGMNQQELDKIYKDVILPGFNSIQGIDHIDSIGNQEAVLDLKLDGSAINAYGLTPAEVSRRIQSAILTSPVGSADIQGIDQMVRVKSDLNSIYSLENMKIKTSTGESLLLKNLVKVEAVTESKFFSRMNGQPAIGVILYKTTGTNSVEFTAEADALIASWKAKYPNIEFTSVEKNSDTVKESINGMVKEGGLGAILASVMILIFLRNVRMTFIVLVSIPLSILVTLLIMAPLDISLNIMTLGGMAIAVGRVVDDSIVVIENIYSELVKTHERGESVIRMATAQVASAITSSTLTTVGVFAPIAFVGGQLGDMFRPFAITLSAALLSSLLVAVTVIPMLAKLLVLRSKNLKVHDETHVGPMAGAYLRMLRWSLKHRIKTMLLALLVFVAAMGGTVPFVPFEFMPSSDSDRKISLWLKMPRETSIGSNDQKMLEIEAMMREAKNAAGQPAFTYVQSLIGYGGGNDRVAYRSQINAEASAGTNAKSLLEDMKTQVTAMLPQGSEVGGSIVSVGGGGGGSGTDFSYMLRGDDVNTLIQGAEMVKAKMKEIPEFQDVKDSLEESKKEVEIAVDQNKARMYDLSSGEIIENLYSWLGEEEIGDLKFDNITLTTKISLDNDFKNSVEKIGSLLIPTPTGQTIRLNEVAKLRQTEGPASIPRDNQEQYVRVTAKIESKDKAGVTAKATEMLGALELPPGVNPEVKGVAEDIDREFKNMFMAMGASVFIVYLVMVLAFGNASAPFAILFSLPLAAIGGMLGLLLTGESLNLTSLIGFMMLIGVVVTNAIVLIDRVQQLREAGMPVREALITAAHTRLRPIIMTAGATVIALMPLALGLSKGTIISKGLAVVVIGGLTTSTLLTLLVVPVVYEIIERVKARVFRKKGAAAGAAKVTPAAQP